jgi:transposase
MMLLSCAALQGHKQHLEILQQMMDAAGVSLIFLPKHCPELNSIELVWSKMKYKIQGTLPGSF